MHAITANLNRLYRVESLVAGLPPVAAHRKRVNEVEKLRRQIPAQVLRLYDHLKDQWQQPVVAVIDGVCQGCQATLTPPAQLALQTKEAAHRCEFCGRFIYFQESPAAKELSEAILAGLGSTAGTGYATSND